MKAPTSLRDLMEGAESLVYVEDLSEKKGLMQAINPLAKLVAIVGMIIASLFITNLTILLPICIIPLVFAVASRVPLKQFFLRTAMITLFAAIISIPPIFLTPGAAVWTTNRAWRKHHGNHAGTNQRRRLHSPRMVLRRLTNHAGTLHRFRQNHKAARHNQGAQRSHTTLQLNIPILLRLNRGSPKRTNRKRSPNLRPQTQL